MNGSKDKDAELWAELEGLDDDLLRADSPMQAVEQVLRDAGEDPTAVASRGAAFVRGLAKERRLSWQRKARRRLAQMSATARRDIRTDLSGEALRLALEKMRASLGPGAAAAFRSRSEVEMTDEERRELLADMETAIAMAKQIRDEDGEDT